MLNSSAQEEESYTVVVNLYQPVSETESELLENILMAQVDYFLRAKTRWNGNRLAFSEKPKKTVSLLNQLVKDDVKFHNYAALSDFKSFSATVEKKIENIQNRAYTLNPLDGNSVSNQQQSILELELSELSDLIRTELLVYGEKDAFIAATEVYPDLTPDEKEALIKEIDEFKDGDLLESIEISYQEIKEEDESKLDLGTDEDERDLADRILDLLAANSQRLERLESELVQMQVGGGNTGSGVSASDTEVLNMLPESMDFYFSLGSARLSSAALLQLNEVVEILARSSKVRVVITGYADQIGNESANFLLSKKRAQTVKRFMTASGMADDRFIINYFGASKSEGVNNQDRRVEIKFFL